MKGLTRPRKRILTNALFSAYMEGWNGDLKETKLRPRFSTWTRGITIQTSAWLFGQGLAQPLASHHADWVRFLTRKGIDLAEQTFRDEHERGRDARTVAEEVIAERLAEEKKRLGEEKEIAHNLRGFTIKTYHGRKALSSVVKDSPLRDGFHLRLNREELLDLSRQIEKLRDA